MTLETQKNTVTGEHRRTLKIIHSLFIIKYDLDEHSPYMQERRVYTYKVTLRQRLKVGGISPYKNVRANPPPFAKEPEPTSSTVPRPATKKQKKHMSMEGFNAARWNLPELKEITTEKFRR